MRIRSDGRIRVADSVCAVDIDEDRGGGIFRLYSVETVIQKICTVVRGRDDRRW